MGKSKKRSREKEEDLSAVLEKIRKLNEKVEKLCEDKAKEKLENVAPNFQPDEKEAELDKTLPNVIQEGASDDHEVLDENEDETGKFDDCPDETEEEWLKILGEDPTECQALQMTARPELIKRWNFFCKEGLKKEDYDALTKKYAILEEFEPPKLNPQIAVTMKEPAVARDNHMVEVQKLAGTALSITGSLITAIYESSDEDIVESLLRHLADSAKILTAIIHKQSNSRKAFIEPGLTKETKVILKDTKIDKFLYGENLSEKIKEARALDKIGENLKIQPVTKLNNNTVSGRNLNGRPPLARRPQMGRGFTSTRGRQRQQLFFRSRQQFINPRAQGPPLPPRPNHYPNQPAGQRPPEKFDRKN